MSTERSADGLLRIVVIVLAVVFLFPLVMMLLAMPMMGMIGWGWAGGAFGRSPLWAIGMLAFWLVVVLGIGYALLRGLSGQVGSRSTDPALEELRLAYARGDLTEEEFESRRETLREAE